MHRPSARLCRVWSAVDALNNAISDYSFGLETIARGGAVSLGSRAATRSLLNQIDDVVGNLTLVARNAAHGTPFPLTTIITGFRI